MAERNSRSSSSATSGRGTKTAGTPRARAEAGAKTGGAETAGPSRASERTKRLREEICGVALIAVGLFMLIAMHTQAAGQVGGALKTLLMGVFGPVAYGLPYGLALYAVLILAKKTARLGGRSLIFSVLVFLLASVLSGVFVDMDILRPTALPALSDLPLIFKAGAAGANAGFLGTLIGMGLAKLIGIPGLCILCSVGILISLLLLIDTPISQMLDRLRAGREARRISRAERAALAEEEALARERAEDARARAAGEAGAREPRAALPRRADDTRKKKHIIEYMNDETLFPDAEVEAPPEPEPEPEPENVEPALGLEPRTALAPGMGLDPAPDADAPAEAPLVTGRGEDAPVGFAGFAAAPGGYGGEAPAPEPPADEAVRGVGDADTDVEKLFARREATDTDDDAPAADHDDEHAPEAAPSVPSDYRLPPPSLLSEPKHGADAGAHTRESLAALADKLERTLADFNVDAKVVDIAVGPAVTRYEIQPGTGVKVSSIKRLEDDIALNLEAKSIRIEAPIPGKAAVGIEVANERIEVVGLREVIESDAFRDAASRITFSVGMDIAGKHIVADLKTMPHLLIAGSTGSGKSVCINSIILSILFKARPDEVRLILIDPKVVELGNYNGIPHLLIPVVTEPGKASTALIWAVEEMNERYRKFGERGVRELESYNAEMRRRNESEAVLPQIVIIIDELADLMTVAPAKVEESICRLAQMARAAGMHLIVATQRPSVDIITGVIKANIPSRIAFAVSSQFDSRTILDMSGAEHLVGRGDMLFNPLGRAKPLRVQGAFVTDDEVHKVIAFVKEGMSASYSEEVMTTVERGDVSSAPDADDADELLPSATELVLKTKQASASMLQRRFRIGYNRAARLIEMLEMIGLIGPADGARPRAVLYSEDEWNLMNGITESSTREPSAPPFDADDADRADADVTDAEAGEDA